MMAVLHTKVVSDRTISLKNPLGDVLLPQIIIRQLSTAGQIRFG